MGFPFVFCASCRHLREGPACDAFPDGIPDDVLFGRVDHRQPIVGDHGVQYEWLPGTTPLPAVLPAFRQYAYLEDWDAAKHPRYPKGHKLAGRFRPKGSAAAVVAKRVAPKLTRKVERAERRLERAADRRTRKLRREFRRGTERVKEKLRQQGLDLDDPGTRHVLAETAREVTAEVAVSLAGMPLGLPHPGAPMRSQELDIEAVRRRQDILGPNWRELLVEEADKLSTLDKIGIRFRNALEHGFPRDPDRFGEYGPIDEKALEHVLLSSPRKVSKAKIAKLRRMGLMDSRAERRKRSKLADKILGSADSTEDLYRDPETGKWSAERKRLHDSIIDTMLRRKSEKQAEGVDPETGLPRMSLDWDHEGEYHAAQDEPTLLMSAGGNAVGKSSVLFTKAKGLYPDDSVHIDFDEVKKMLPEFQQFAKARDIYGTDATHFESAYIAKRLLEEARRRRMNIVIDASGDGSSRQFERTIERFDADGYTVDAVMVDAPLGLAVQSMVERGDGNGRYVPVPIMYRIHRNSVARFDEWRKNTAIRHMEVWRREKQGGGPEDFQLVADGDRGKTHVLDRAMWNRLMRKGRRFGGTGKDVGRID